MDILGHYYAYDHLLRSLLESELCLADETQPNDRWAPRS